MRTLVMFDLPTDTSIDRQRYRKFRRFLLQDGFIMMQESIYTKICLNGHAVTRVEERIEKHKPPQGIVQILTVTEKQFTKMRLIVGDTNNNYIQNDQRLVII